MKHRVRIAADSPPPEGALSSDTPRPTLGFMAASLYLDISGLVWHGALEAAERLDLNLICFPGGALHEQTNFEYQRNAVYDLIDSPHIQGLVSWASSLGTLREPDSIDSYHRRFRDRPLVSLTQRLSGVPCVAIDSYQGAWLAMEHLIAVHGYRKIAFIRGPAGHHGAEERFLAYRDMLEQHAIPFDPRLVSAPLPFQEEAGVLAVQQFFDQAGLQPQVDIEAILMVNDLPALGVLQELRRRGMFVPRDIALIGFNDTQEGQLASPPLSSVALPFAEQGSRAVELLHGMLRGESVPPSVRLPSRLIVRQSCGCPSPIILPSADSPAPTDERPLRDQLFERLEVGVGAELLPEALPFVEALLADAQSPDSRQSLLYFERILSQHTTSTNFASWQELLQSLYHILLPALPLPTRFRIEALLHQARLLLSDLIQRSQGQQSLQNAKQAVLLREIGQELITAFDLEHLSEVLLARLPQLGIASCYLALYDEPSSRETARLILAYTQHRRVVLGAEQERFATRQLLPDGLLPSDRRYSLVVEPLYFRDLPIGYAIFELGPRDGEIYEVLRGHLSSAIKGALLVQEALRARQIAENADQIKTRLLANVSHELRAPLHIILEQTQALLPSAAAQDAEPSAMAAHLQHIQRNAQHQLRLINDLLDLSRADIGELDLYPELLDPHQLLSEVFHSLADTAGDSAVRWQLQLPERLPWIYADGLRLCQILLNLLSNARKFTEQGQISLGAELSSSQLHIWVQDTGVGVLPQQQERIFEPFATAAPQQDGSIGLGLSITRRLVLLHQGRITLESVPTGGSIFHLYLPLPSLSAQQAPIQPEQLQPILLVLSRGEELSRELVDFSQRQGLQIQQLSDSLQLEELLKRLQPSAFAWDMRGAQPSDWPHIRWLQGHPRWSRLPFMLYGQPQGEGGFTNVMLKPIGGETLLDVIGALCETHTRGSIIIIDDDPAIRARYTELVAGGFPDAQVAAFADGRVALQQMQEEVPRLVLLDLVMPAISGIEVLEQMRATPALSQVPVVVLSNKLLSFEDVKQLEQHTHVTLQSKGVLSEDEMLEAFQRALLPDNRLPPYTSALVKRAIAYLHQNYTHAVARWELAEAVGVSADYLGRTFSRELGMSPWDYLNRYRIHQAKALLLTTNESIAGIAQQVGFNDQRYFSRVFRKLTGVGPKEFRQQ